MVFKATANILELTWIDTISLSILLYIVIMMKLERA